MGNEKPTFATETAELLPLRDARLDSLVARILADAEAEAKSILADADARKLRLEEETAARALAIEKEAADLTARAVEDIRRSARMRGAMDGKIRDLETRRAILDEVYAAALEQLCHLDGKAYADFVAKAVKKHSEYGDTIILAKGANVERSFVMNLPEYESKTLRLSSEPGDFCGGLVLEGKIYDKRLTFEELLVSLRERTESKISAELFGE